MFGINFSAKREAARRQIQEYETSLTRKNARIADKILLSLPVEMTLEQRAKAVRAFLWELTGYGKGRALACFHDQGSHNPHVHIFLVDKDAETGKPVFRTTDKGSTNRIRALWETICNDKLEEFGFETRVDRRSRIERGIEGAPQEVKKSYRKQNATKRHQPQIEADAPVINTEQELQPRREPEPLPEREEPVVEIINLADTSNPATIRLVANAEEELNRLLGVKEFRREVEARITTVTKQILNNTRRAADLNETLGHADLAARTAEANLAAHKGLFGRLRGFSVMGIKTGARRRAEAAQARTEMAHNQLDYARTNLERINADYTRMSAEGAELIRQKGEAEKQMERWGTAQEMADAETILTNTIQYHAKNLDQAKVRTAYLEKQITENDYNRALRVIQQAGRDAANGGMSR